MRSAWTVSDWGKFARRHYGPDAMVVARMRPEREPAMPAESEELKGFFEEKIGILERAGLSKPEAEAEAARLVATLARNRSYSWASLRAALADYRVLLAQVPHRPGAVDALPLVATHGRRAQGEACATSGDVPRAHEAKA